MMQENEQFLQHWGVKTNIFSKMLKRDSYFLEKKNAKFFTNDTRERETCTKFSRSKNI